MPQASILRRQITFHHMQVPLQLTLDCIKTAIHKSPYRPPLPTDDLTDPLHLCLTSTYIQYNGKHYKQKHGIAIGSPVSVVVAGIASNAKHRVTGPRNLQ